ncbi:MAG: hypothetical protein D6820_15830, partial [Lentisphaerae bacterium]
MLKSSVTEEIVENVTWSRTNSRCLIPILPETLRTSWNLLHEVNSRNRLEMPRSLPHGHIATFPIGMGIRPRTKLSCHRSTLKMNDARCSNGRGRWFRS